MQRDYVPCVINDNTYMPVKSARSGQSWIKNIRQVCCSHQDYSLYQVLNQVIDQKKVNLRNIIDSYILHVPHSVQSHPFQQAIDAVSSQYVLPLLSCRSHGVNFINKNYARPEETVIFVTLQGFKMWFWSRLRFWLRPGKIVIMRKQG